MRSRAAFVRLAVRPAADEEPDEAPGLPADLGAAGPGARPFHAVKRERGELQDRCVCLGDAGDHALDRDAAGGVVADRARGETRHGPAPLIGVDLHVGQAGMIVHSDVREVPAGAAAPLPAPAPAKPPAAAVTCAPQLLHAGMHKIAGVRMPVADGLLLGRALPAAQTPLAVARKHRVDG